MPVTLKQVQKVIREQFPGADVGGVTEKNHRVFGAIIWDGFTNKDFEERSRLITEKIRDSLGFSGINIGVLFPLAPGEKL